AAIPDETTRRQFDGLLDGARREARAYEDHNYYIDCAAGALLHRALMAAARRLAGAGTLSSPDDVWWLRHHEIAAVLQALDAGVLWTPVFPVAAAVVLDEGVLFQHAMLTCREYGVPGIFQAKQATTVLHEGQLVTVDGTNGWVLPAEMS